jgi:hypothetical protein
MGIMYSENAIEATAGNTKAIGRKVEVCLDRKRRWIRISDNGVGLTAETMKRAHNIGASVRTHGEVKEREHLTSRFGKYGVGKQATYLFSGNTNNTKKLMLSKVDNDENLHVSYTNQLDYDSKMSSNTTTHPNWSDWSKGERWKLEKQFLGGVCADSNPFVEQLSQWAMGRPLHMPIPEGAFTGPVAAAKKRVMAFKKQQLTAHETHTHTHTVKTARIPGCVVSWRGLSMYTYTCAVRCTLHDTRTEPPYWYWDLGSQVKQAAALLLIMLLLLLLSASTTVVPVVICLVRTPCICTHVPTRSRLPLAVFIVALPVCCWGLPHRRTWGALRLERDTYTNAEYRMKQRRGPETDANANAAPAPLAEIDQPCEMQDSVPTLARTVSCSVGGH